MREALARSDLDFVVSESGKDDRKSGAARLPRILRVASIATALLFCTIIILNALFLQDRKHPAPLLRAPDPADTAAVVVSPPAPAPAMPQRSSAPAAPVQVAAPIAPAPAKPAGRDAIADEISRVAMAAPAAERKPVKPVPAKASEERHDVIAGLIGAGQESSASVMAAQKALLRLGYVVRADGVFGATTRQAIARYERDNKLPVHGELTPKLAKQLATKAGSATQ